MAGYFDGGKGFVSCEGDMIIFRPPLRWKIQLGVFMVFAAAIMSAGLSVVQMPKSYATDTAAWAGIPIILLGLALDMGFVFGGKSGGIGD